jgi:transposase
VTNRTRLQGGHADAIAQRERVTKATVGKWRARFVRERLDGLVDEPRPGARRQISDAHVERVITMTLESTPRDATHWSTRTMAKATGMSQSAVSRMWRAFALQPHRVETFKLSKDPLFVDKVRDIVGLYLDPPERALVLCVDEKSQIQALDRSAPILPCRSGCRSAARMTIAATARPHSLRRSTWRRGVSSASAIAVTAARSFSGF